MVKSTQKTQKIVMCVNTWPEQNQSDFAVFNVKDDESDEEAINRAKKEYSENNTFYIAVKGG